MIFSLREFLDKSGLKKCVVATSGGIDSALICALAKLSLREDESCETIFMPSEFSSKESFDLAKELSENLDLEFYNFSIDDTHKKFREEFKQTFGEKASGLVDENIQSRLRGAFLFSRANKKNQLVLNTSNKSEIAVGYSTIYGDSVGAVSLLGDLYKSEVYQLAEYLNRKYENFIPEKIIKRLPTAELKLNQKDEDFLPPYEKLDVIIDGILSYNLSFEDFLEFGFSREDIEKIYSLYIKSEYKRFQFCPIIKLKRRSFGIGYRNPIYKSSGFYFLEN